MSGGVSRTSIFQCGSGGSAFGQAGLGPSRRSFILLPHEQHAARTSDLVAAPGDNKGDANPRSEKESRTSHGALSTGSADPWCHPSGTCYPGRSARCVSGRRAPSSTMQHLVLLRSCQDCSGCNARHLQQELPRGCAASPVFGPSLGARSGSGSTLGRVRGFPHSGRSAGKDWHELSLTAGSVTCSAGLLHAVWHRRPPGVRSSRASAAESRSRQRVL